MITKAEVVAQNDNEIFLRVPKLVDNLGDVLVELDDGRGISTAQRRKAYVLLNCIADHTGYSPEETKEVMKFYYAGWTEHLNREFSLSNCSMETASEFITFLIDYCLTNGVACNEPLQSLCCDLERYIYSCLMNKKCCVCGRKGELHHIDTIGSGGNRKTMYQVGMRVMPLCRKHHTEMHTIPDGDFYKRYHVCPVPLTEKVGKVYRMSKKNLEKKQ